MFPDWSGWSARFCLGLIYVSVGLLVYLCITVKPDLNPLERAALKVADNPANFNMHEGLIAYLDTRKNMTLVLEESEFLDKSVFRQKREKSSVFNEYLQHRAYYDSVRISYANWKGLVQAYPNYRDGL